ncbi:MAG: hypothetical protein AB1830_13180 [Pseudomonadota bacterium]
MSTTLWSAWYDEVLTDVPGCPRKMAEHAIRRAAIAFCERSTCWQQTLDPMDVDAGEAEYAWELPPSTRVVRPEMVWHGGKPLAPKTLAQLAELYQSWTTVRGTPLHYVQDNPEILRLVPIPEAALAAGLLARVSLAPAATATGVPSWLFNRHYDAIAHGAKARLFAMKQKPWSEPGLAAYHRALFDQMAGGAQLQAGKGHTRAPQRTKSYFL